MCVPVRVYKHNEYTGTCGRQRALDPLELDLQATVYQLILMLVTKFESSVRVASALNH